MTSAEFEEKTFEVAANNEFALLSGGYNCPVCGNHHCHFCGAMAPPAAVDMWAPGQVLEGDLGFDVLIQLDRDAPDLEAMIGAAIPAGMNWKRHFGSPAGAGAAPQWASLFIQYKRPDWLVRRRGKFLDLFPAGPYFRFDLDADQHTSLVGLRNAANAQALVLFAAPRFHTNADMLHYRQNRLVLERTAFIDVGDSTGHAHGAYNETTAFLCSEPAEVRLQSLPGILAAVRRMDLIQPVSDPRGALREHIRRIAAAITDASDGQMEPNDRDEALQGRVESILRFTAQARATWLLAAVYE